MSTQHVALVGAGSFGQAHLRAYGQIDRAGVTWVCDRDPDLARRVAQEWGVPRWTGDITDVLSDPDVELVDLVTPVALHAPQAIAALEAGKSVLCEKPMALDLDEALWMAEVAEAATGQLHVKYHQRFDPVHALVRDAVRDQRYGRALVAHISLLGDHTPALRSRTHWRGDPKMTGGGCLFESGAHLIDLAHFWFGPARHVTARTHQLAVDNPDKGEDTATLVVEFVGGEVLTLVGFWGAPAWDWRKDVFTSDQVRLGVTTGTDNVLVLERAGGDRETLAVQEDWFARSVQASIAHTLAAIAGEEEQAVPLPEALASMRTLEAAYRSEAEGRTVELA